MKAGHVIALCIFCTAAGAQLGGQPIPLGGTPVGGQLGGSSQQLPSPYKAIQYKNVAQGVYSRINQSRTDVVTNGQGWQKLYSAMAGDTREGQTPAPVLCDFNKFDLLVIHLGQQRTAGFSTYVSMVRREKGSEVTVDVVINQPAPNAVSAQVLTSPYVVAVVEKQNVPYVFRSTFGYANPSAIGGSPCNCNCGCPCCGSGRSGTGNGQSFNPFGPEICPPFPRGGRGGE